METTRVIRAASVSGARKLGVSSSDSKRAEAKGSKESVHSNAPSVVLSDGGPQAAPTYHAELVESLKLQLKELEQKHAALQLKFDDVQMKYQAQSDQLTQDKMLGFKSGYQDGAEDARNEVQKELDTLREAAALFKQWMQAEFSGLEALAAEMTLEALIKIVGEQYADEKFVVGVIRQVSSQIRDTARVTLRVNKRDQEILGRHLADLKDMLGTAIDIQADIRVQSGGCLIETDTGTLDGRLDTQIRNLQESILAVVREAKTSS